MGYYVFDYCPSDELKVREHIENLQKKYNSNLTGYELKVFDIYDLLLDYIEKRAFIRLVLSLKRNMGWII